MIISKKIFYVMEQKNITQLELQEEPKLQRATSVLERKDNPKADCLLSICDALDITPEQL